LVLSMTLISNRLFLSFFFSCLVSFCIPWSALLVFSPILSNCTWFIYYLSQHRHSFFGSVVISQIFLSYRISLCVNCICKFILSGSEKQSLFKPNSSPQRDYRTWVRLVL
jgi:hypothetical protein